MFTGAVKKIEINGKVWLHRNNHNGDNAWKLLGFDKSGNFSNPTGKGEYYISVGCYSRNLSVESYERITEIKNDDDKKWIEFEKTCSEELYKELKNQKPRFRYSLWRFLFEFKKDAILLVPGTNRDFHVFRIISEKPVMRDEIKEQFPNIDFDDKHDFHFFWKV